MKYRTVLHIHLNPTMEGGKPFEFYFDGMSIDDRHKAVIIEALGIWTNRRNAEYIFDPIIDGMIFILKVDKFPQYVVEVKQVRVITVDGEGE